MPTTIHGTNGITFNDGSTQTTRSAVGFRNRIINGTMVVDQRSSGGAGSATNTSRYTSSDRWASLTAAIGATIWTHQRVLTGDTDFPFASRLQRNAGASNVGEALITQVIESTNCRDLAGQSATLSFYALRGADFSPTSSLLTAQVSFGSGNDQGLVSGTFGNWTSQTFVTLPVNLTTTRTRYSTTVTVPVGTNEILVRFLVTPTGTAGANDWFQVTGVQFEAGPSPTDFERRPFGLELGLCQRYYQKRVGDSYSTGVVGQAYGTATVYGSVSFTQEMRRAPDVTLNPVGSAAGTMSFMNNLLAHPATMGTISANTIHVNGFQMLGTGYTSGFTAGNASLLYRNGLGEIWNASAEL